ncbi:MAG: D-2-hydroxyacid dehydrogenase [Gemmataceae bacterium]
MPQRVIMDTHKPLVLLTGQIRDETTPRLERLFPDLRFIDGREIEVCNRHLPEATIMLGVPSVGQLVEAKKLRWVQLLTAGVPQKFREPARDRGLTVTNLAGLFGAGIAEHVLCLMMTLSRHVHTAIRNQFEERWEKELARIVRDIRGRTVGIIGLGDIGRGVGRLAQAHGMRVVGIRRTSRRTPFVDHVYAFDELETMLAEIDFLVVAAPLTAHTRGLIGPEEFANMKKGVFVVNVGRGPIIQETALLEALNSGHVAGAALDVFEKEPLAPGHPLWSIPQVIVSPHYSGDNIYETTLPTDRFIRNLRLWLKGEPLENVVDLERGY